MTTITVSGFHLNLRPVTEADAADIIELRTQPTAAPFLGPTSTDVEAQRAWLRAALARDNEHYFAIESGTAKMVGTIGLYNIADRRAEWGRWVLRAQSPAAAGSALLMYGVAFEKLALESVFCLTLEANVQTVSFHDSSGAQRIGPQAGEVAGKPVTFIRHEVTAQQYRDVVRAKLLPAAKYAERVLSR